MPGITTFLKSHSQNSKLHIRLISPTFGRVAPEIAVELGVTHRKPYYFLLFMLKGKAQHGVDLKLFDVGDSDLLFILPHQIHSLPLASGGIEYFKLGFDESCLSLLPRQYLFLVNPLNNQKIHFQPAAASRLKLVFEVLTSLLSEMNTEPEIILAHLHGLLTEINAAYFSNNKSPPGEHLAKYVRFKIFVEDHFSEQPSIGHIAEALSINVNSLYSIVKKYSGISPKEYLHNRLVLEAKRRLYYAESASVKELAYDLGFNDPEYFSRLFKNITGQTVTGFMQDLSGD